MTLLRLILIYILMAASFEGLAAGALSQPDTTETSRMREWRELKYGIFLHFGMSTFTGNEFDPGDQPSTTYAPKHADVEQWVRVASAAGMKYAVLTAKHVAGHCLWDSKVQFRGKEFDYDIATSGNTNDVVREFVDACRNYDMTPGLYYCLLDFRNNPIKPEHQWGRHMLPDEFFALAKGQLTELARNYPSVRYYWLDIPRAASEAQRAELYDLLRRENSRCVVLFNCGFLDKQGTAGFTVESTKGASWPTDVLNSERDVIPAVFNPVQTWRGTNFFLGYEHCDVVGKNWFWTAQDQARPTDKLFELYHHTVVRAGGNLLLDVGPNREGKLDKWQITALMGLKQRIDSQARYTTLEEDFQNPPIAARPYVWWHWMGANFSKAGITRDLEAMKAAGIGGATVFNLSSAVQESQAPTLNNPWPDQTYRSPKYWEAIRHAAAEADRLGLEIGLHNTVGYSTTGGPWIDEKRSMQRLVWSSVSVAGGAPVITNIAPPKLGKDDGWGATGRQMTFYRDVAVLAVPAGSTNLAVSEVLDLTKNFSTSGELNWNAPAGNWVVYRLGHSSTGRSPHPVPDDVIGKTLEADKISLEQTKFHWTTVIDPLKEQLGPLFGKSFRHFLIDSYEAGNQNWSSDFRAEFQKRKGYDPLPWLVTLGATVQNGGKNPPARTVGSAAQTARFEWDYRDVISTLYFENGWQPAAKMIHEAGVKFQWEAYGGPFNTVEGSALADLPMTEFWTGRAGGANQAIVGAARAAGKTIVGAEAFTGRPEVSKWTETPAFLKAAGDSQFASGVNLMILHHWVHQPFDDRYKPGMGMGWWGTHFSRNQTWFEPGKEFFRYLGRVQALLQRGEAPADFVSVGSVQGDGDVIPLRALKDVRVADGKVLLPSGRQYAFISFPHNGAMLPEVLAQVKNLLADGATVVCSKPNKSPSLANFPACDDEVCSLAMELWGDGKQTVRQVGRGKLFAGGDVGVALRELGIAPIAQNVTPKVENIRIAARVDGATKIFFIANLNQKPAKFTVSLRVSGMQPELWDAETGEMQLAPLWREKDGRTEVDFSLGAAKSVFVVFRSKAKSADKLASVEAAGNWTLSSDKQGRAVISASTNVSGTAVFASGKREAFELKPAAAIPLSAAWSVDLAPAVGVKKQIELPALKSLSESADAAVKYFSGTATYRTTVNVDATLLGTGKRVELDLGDVRDLVTVRVNGKNIYVLWHPPFVCDITSALQPGANTLELAVANTWHNRLVGDEQFPPDFEFGTDRSVDKGRALKAYPDWFVKNQPRPETNRLAFVNWFYHRKDTPLIPSGLLGPVQLIPIAEAVLNP